MKVRAMEATRRVTQEGLPLTRAMRDCILCASRSRFIRFAIFVAVGLIFFLSCFVSLDVASEQSRARLGFYGLLICLLPVAAWVLLAVVIGRPILTARRLARYGTYARYVGPFTAVRWEGRKYASYSLEFADKRLTLGDITDVEEERFDVLRRHRSGVVDWIPGFHALAVWDDHGNCVFRVKDYEADPEVPPPPVRRPARTGADPKVSRRTPQGGDGSRRKRSRGSEGWANRG